MNVEKIQAYYAARPHYWRALHIRRWITVFPLLESATSILDVGCGYGDLAWVLAENGVRVPFTGIDLVPEHIAWCRTHMTGPKWILGDIFTEEFPGESFDSVVSICCLSGEGHDEPSVAPLIAKMWRLATRQVILLENAFLDSIRATCQLYPGYIRNTGAGEVLVWLSH